jgi:hypothetical protein
MKNCVIAAINGDVHIDGQPMTPEEAIAFARRITVAAKRALEQTQQIRLMIVHAGERMAHDSMRDQREEMH